MSEQEMLETMMMDAVQENFMGPPTEEEYCEMIQDRVDYIDHQMLLNAR